MPKIDLEIVPKIAPEIIPEIVPRHPNYYCQRLPKKYQPLHLCFWKIFDKTANVIRAYDQQMCLDEELCFVRSLNRISNLGHDHIFVWYPALIKLTS